MSLLSSSMHIMISTNTKAQAHFVNKLCQLLVVDMLNRMWFIRAVWLAGIPIDVLSLDFWVPGSTSQADLPKYHDKPIFREVLTTTAKTCVLYAERATKDRETKLSHRLVRLISTFSMIHVPCVPKDFSRKASKDSSTKVKAGWWNKCSPTRWCLTLEAMHLNLVPWLPRKHISFRNKIINYSTTFAVCGYGWSRRWRCSSQERWSLDIKNCLTKGSLSQLY